MGLVVIVVGRAFHNSESLVLIALTPDIVFDRGTKAFPQVEARLVVLPWRSGLVRSNSAVECGEWLWVQTPSIVVGTPCRGP